MGEEKKLDHYLKGGPRRGLLGVPILRPMTRETWLGLERARIGKARKV